MDLKQIGYVIGDKFYIIKKIDDTWSTLKEATHLQKLLSYLKANRLIEVNTDSIMGSSESYKFVAKTPTKMTLKEAQKDNLEIIYIYYNTMDEAFEKANIDIMQNPTSSFFKKAK